MLGLRSLILVRIGSVSSCVTLSLSSTASKDFHILFIHSPFDEHLGVFQDLVFFFFAIIRKASMNIHGQIFLVTVIFICADINTREWNDWVECWCSFHFLRNCELLSKVTGLLYMPAQCEGFRYFTSLAVLAMISCLNADHLRRSFYFFSLKKIIFIYLKGKSKEERDSIH